MIDWRPASGADAARRRAELKSRVRRYFEREDVLEVDTPALGPAANTDPALENFAVSAANGRPLYLQTSPEFCMKRLLAAGYPDIYSIARVFRDGETGRRHLPEFTLIEWYRRGFGLDAIIGDTAALIADCLQSPALPGRLARLDYRQTFLEAAGVDVFTAACDELAAAACADDALRESVGDDRDAWLDLLMESRVQPAFDPDRMTVLQHFPASKAALARLCPDDRRVADRFELFLGGMELANGYVELTDPVEQRRRIEAENERRRATGKPVLPADERLLAALEAGLPGCAGVALGFERLQMVYDRSSAITTVVTFGAESGDGRGTGLR